VSARGDEVMLDAETELDPVWLSGTVLVEYRQ